MFDLRTTAECGWETLRNGKLLNAAEKDGFEVLLSGDKSLHLENEIAGRRKRGLSL